METVHSSEKIHQKTLVFFRFRELWKEKSCFCERSELLVPFGLYEPISISMNQELSPCHFSPLLRPDRLANQQDACDDGLELKPWKNAS